MNPAEQWIQISHVEIPKVLEFFKNKDDEYLLPPSFHNVWILKKGCKTKIKAFWDHPCRQWYRCDKDVWNSPKICNSDVTHWTLVKNGELAWDNEKQKYIVNLKYPEPE